MRLWQGRSGLGCALLVLLFAAAPAQVAAAAYPPGGGQFKGGAEGWQVTAAGCDVPAACTAGGGYDGGHGNPSGSLSADTTIDLNLLTLFHSHVTLQSPDFVVGGGGAATVHLEREFDPGSLVDLAPQVEYSVELVDRSSGKRSTAVSETVEGAAGWHGFDGAATVKSGDTYALAIAVSTSSSMLGTGLLGGSTSARFDNIALTVGSDTSTGGRGGADVGGGNGAGEGSGTGSGLTDARFAALAPAAVVGPARLRGRRLLVKARCPKRVGRACRLSLVGLLGKRRPATARRTVRIAKGKTKRLVLRVKPRAKRKVAGRRRLLFKLHLRAGAAKATVYKRLRLIRR
jgi:hypothetical protein